MSCKSLMLMMVCLVAAMMLTFGCGNGGDEPADPNAGKPEPATQPTVTPPDTPKVTPPDTPKVTPPDTPKVTPPDTPKVTPPDTPKVTPPDTPKPTGGEKIKTGWSDAKVGTMVKFKMQNNMTMSQEVTKVTDDAVTVKVTTVAPAMPVPMVRNQDFPRYGKPAPDGKAGPENVQAKGKKLPDQTLTVAGKSLKCEVWEVVTEAGGKKITSRSYMCKDVPGWIVKSENDALGSMATMMELVEFKE